MDKKEQKLRNLITKEIKKVLQESYKYNNDLQVIAQDLFKRTYDDLTSYEKNVVKNQLKKLDIIKKDEKINQVDTDKKDGKINTSKLTDSELLSKFREEIKKIETQQLLKKSPALEERKKELMKLYYIFLLLKKKIKINESHMSNMYGELKNKLIQIIDEDDIGGEAAVLDLLIDVFDEKNGTIAAELIKIRDEYYNNDENIFNPYGAK